jgi:HK97 family phage major capsid protein
MGDKGETLNAAEADEFEDLRTELDVIDKQLERLRFAERISAQTAVPVTPRAAEPGRIEPVRVEPIVKTGERLEPGMRMARVAKCIVLQKMTGQDPVVAALRDYPHDPVIAAVTKAAVAAGTTMDPTWAGALVGEEGSVYADFVAFLRAQTILGQFGTNGIPSLRNIPFRTPLLSQTTGGAGFWVGEGNGKPVTKFDFARTTLEPLKVANISVLTKELIRDSSPKADVEVRNSLVEALKERLDTDFIDPAKAAVAGISPASVTNGVAPIPSSGTDSDALRADIKAAYAAYTAGKVPLRGGVWVMEPALAASVGMMTNLLGTPEFAGIGQNGGSLAGFPVIASDYVPTGIVALLNAPEIYYGDEGGFEVSMSDQASIEMSDAPTQNAGTPAASQNGMVSMFQTNSVAILAERAVNWAKRRPNAAVVISGADWGASGGATLGAGRSSDRVSKAA